MVEYTEWTRIMFEEHPAAEATVVISTAAAEWRELKDELRQANEEAAREHASSL